MRKFIRKIACWLISILRPLACCPNCGKYGTAGPPLGPIMVSDCPGNQDGSWYVILKRVNGVCTFDTIQT